MSSPLCCSLLLAAAVSVLSANPGATVPLATALESNLTWRTGGEAPWFGSAMVSHDGVDAARSGGGGAGESWLETDATGPGALTFWAQTSIGGSRVSVGGSAQDQWWSDQWVQHRLRLGPGAQTVRWVAQFDAAGNTGAAAMFLDEVNFTPSAPVSLGEAVDAPGLTWSGSAGTFGFSETGAGVTGGDFVVVQARAGTGGSVTAALTGPAVVRFRWKMTGYAAGAEFKVRTGGFPVTWTLPAAPANSARGAEEWFDAEVLVPADSQLIQWLPDAGGDFLLDAVSVAAAPNVGAAIGQPGLTWNSNWLTRPAAQAIGGAVAVTPLLNNARTAALSALITGPAEVSYVSALLRSYHSAAFTPYGAVGVRVGPGSGTLRTTALPDGWFRSTFFVPEGVHYVLWVAADTNESNFDTWQGVLDDVQLTPAAPASLAEALKTTLAPQVTEGAALAGRWRGMKSLTSGLNGSAVVCGPLAEGEATTLTLPVAGPARLMFSVRGERWQRDLQVKLTGQLDGADVLPADAVTGPAAWPQETPADWRTLLVTIPSGAHTLTLRASEAAPGALLWLDAAGYLPADPGASKIAAAVEMPGTLWRRISPPGRGAWRHLATPMAAEGRTLAACMDVPAGQSASLETTLAGPGVLTFTWAQAVNGTLAVSVNDAEAASAPYIVPNTAGVELLLPRGPQTVRWTFSPVSPLSPPAVAAQAWLDGVQYTPLPAGTSPAPGLDVTAPMTTDTDWTWRTAVPAFSATGDGDAALVEVPQAGAASLEMPLTGPARFAFWWRAETDFLHGQSIALAVDGVETAWLPDRDNWYRSEITVGPGAHTLRWIVKATGSSLQREDVRRVWLDGFTALPTLPLAVALDNNLAWSAGAPSDAADFTDWTGLPAAETAANPGTDDAAVTSGTRPLTTQVTGPGVVTFRWAEKSVPPLPVVEMPEPPPAPGSPAWAGGYSSGTLVLSGSSTWSGWNWWRPPPPRAVFAVNGFWRATLELSESSFDSAWAAHTFHLGPGEHTLTWQRPARSNGRRLVVESMSFAPAPDVFAPVAAELGVPVDGFVMNDTPWTVQRAQTHDSSAALQSGATASGQSTLERSFTGPGELSFWWKGTAGADFRNPFYDPDPNGWIIIIGPEPWLAPAEWQRFTLSIPAGQHRYSWRAAPGATLWLDEVTYATPQPLAGPNAVAEALDFSGFTWNAPGWQPMTGGGLGETRDALYGPAFGGAEDAWLATTATGPATVRFSRWLEAVPTGVASGTAGAVKFLLDGVETAIVSTDGIMEVAVPAGSHSLRFIFPGGTAQHLRPVLDDVRLATTVGEALGPPALTWTSNSMTTPWRGWQSDRYAGHSTWVEAPLVTDHALPHGMLSTAVTGPARVSFDVLLPAPAPAPDGHTWQISTETLMLEVDGVEIWRAPAAAEGWQTVTAFAGPGTHTIVWKARRNFRCRLDNCIITPDPAPQPTLAEALETPGREFFGALYTWPPDWSPLRSAANGPHDDSAIAFYNASRASSLRTTVQGPAWVTFDYRSVGLALKVITGDGLRYTLEPDYYYSGYPPPAPIWRSAPRVFIPAGSHECLWQTGAAGSSPAMPWVQVDAITITPLYAAPADVPLAEALDAPGLTFTNSGTTAWSGHAVAGVTGDDAAVAIATAASAELNTTVTGPGTLVWRWKVESFGTAVSYNPPSLHLLVNGLYKVSQGRSTPAEWMTAEWLVPPGEHSVRWLLRSNWDNSIGCLDDVRFLAAPTLAEALDLPAGLVVNVQAGAPAPATLRDGSDVVFLDAATGNGPVLNATVTGPGELAFDWKNTLPSNSFTRLVTVDGQPAGDWYPAYAPGTSAHAFSRAFIAVGPGEHVIRWHADFTGGGDGAGLWLDRMTWSAGTSAWAQAAGGTGANGLTAWITGGVPPWSAAAGAGLNNNAAATSTGGWLAAVMPPGPGTLCWWGRTEGDASGTGSLQGPGLYPFLSRDWRFVRASRTAGQPPPLWRTYSEAFVTGVNFTPAVIVPLPQALDAPAVVFESSPDAPWSGVVVEGAPLGSSAARSGYDTGNEGSWVRTAFTGPGRLNYSWRFQRGVGVRSPRIRVSVDTFDSDLSSTSGPSWRAESVWLEAGAHTVTWRLWAGVEGDDLWLDSVAFTPAVPVSLATALEYTGAPWTTGGTGTWSGLSSIPDTSGDDAAISPPLGANEEAWLETAVPGSGVLTWRWRLIPGGNPAEFEFLLDGLPLTSLTQTEVWQTDRWELPSGPHTLRWRYKAPWAEDRGAMLDGVSFTPAPPPAWNAALGAQTVPLGGGGVTPWNVATEEGVAFLRNNLPHSLSDGTLIYGSSGLFADITGPAVVTYDARLSAGYTLWLDGEVEVFYFSPDWRNSRLLVPAGRHRLRWDLLPSGTNRQVDLRQLTVTPISPIPLTEAVEATGLALFNDATHPWIGIREAGSPDDDDYAAVLVPPLTGRTLEVEFTGPGILRSAWDWPAEDFNTGASLVLTEGEVELQRFGMIFGEDQWSTVRQFGPGVHRVKFGVHAWYQFFEPHLKSLQFEQWPTVDIPTAFGAPGRTFTTDGAGWVAGLVRPELANQGNSVVWMQVESDSDLADPPWLETVVTGPAHVSFWWRISAPNFSNLWVWVDDVPHRSFTNYSALDAEGNATVRIPPGNHRLRWQWQRASGPEQPGTLDSVLLDRLVITPATTLSLSEAADAPSLTFTPVAGDWRGWQSAEAVTGGDFIEVSRSDSAAVSLNVPLTGPGVLRWSWKNDTPGWGHGFSALLQGRIMAQVQVAGQWQTGFIAVPPGAQTVTFEMGASAITGALGGLDNFSWQPTSAALTAAAAVEASGLSNIAPVTPGDWFPLESAALSSDGTDALVAGVPGREHRLRAQATGPGTLSYVTNAHYVPGGSNLASVRLLVDGIFSNPAALQNAPGGLRVLHFTGNGAAHTFEWMQEFNDFYRAESDYAWLDALAFTPAAPVPLAVALEQPAWSYYTSGPVPWQGGTSPAGVNGNLAWTLLSSAAPNVPESFIETTLPAGPGVVAFDFKYPPGTGWFVLDGQTMSGGSVAYAFGPGLHSIRWAVRQATPATDATVTLDNLEWLPATWSGWQAHHFPAGTPVAVSDFAADPDNDGRPNGLEAWLGSSPLRADTEPPLNITPLRFPYLTFDTVFAPPQGITLAIEIANNPAGPWSTVCQCTAPDPWSGPCYYEQPPARARERRYFYAGSEAVRFYRLRVSK